ncbi:hypothetical protein [Paenibacillus macerans]|uniref:hypothetical protein n=1 Tax=Paenibacillus macerans TaxID=44252 RepID=UPI00203B388A|nr:hypothetical protein [Paenibacillus macerans]MCM3703776.1 hypothetical protein [Paenibacillus macerans]
MAKSKHEIENAVVRLNVIKLQRPSIEEVGTVELVPRCAWEGCRNKIYTLLDDYLEIDDMLFCSDRCAVEHYMKEAGGRRVHGGAC